MINLKRWRESQARRYKCLALCIVSMCSMLIIIPAMIFLIHMQQQKERLYLAVLKLPKRSTVVQQTNVVQVNALYKLAWEKHRYVVNLIQKLAAIPKDVELISLHCHLLHCEFNVASHQAQRLIHAFSHHSLKDIKQGGCPLCYHAKIDVTLS